MIQYNVVFNSSNTESVLVMTCFANGDRLQPRKVVTSSKLTKKSHFFCCVLTRALPNLQYRVVGDFLYSQNNSSEITVQNEMLFSVNYLTEWLISNSNTLGMDYLAFNWGGVSLIWYKHDFF